MWSGWLRIFTDMVVKTFVTFVRLGFFVKHHVPFVKSNLQETISLYYSISQQNLITTSQSPYRKLLSYWLRPRYWFFGCVQTQQNEACDQFCIPALAVGETLFIQQCGQSGGQEGNSQTNRSGHWLAQRNTQLFLCLSFILVSKTCLHLTKLSCPETFADCIFAIITQSREDPDMSKEKERDWKMIRTAYNNVTFM